MASLIVSEAELYRQSLQQPPNVRFRSNSFEVGGEFKAEEDDATSISRHKNIFQQKLVLRIILGAISATFPGLGIIVFPLLFCTSPHLYLFGVLLASYEVIFLLNVIFVAHWVPITEKVVVMFALLGFGLLVFAVLYFEEILFIVLPFLGVSSSLQTSLLVGLEKDRNNPHNNSNIYNVSDNSALRVTITSDVLFWQYLSFFGPALGILCGLAGPKVAPILVVVLGMGLSVVMLALTAVSADGWLLTIPSPTALDTTASSSSSSSSSSRHGATAAEDWLLYSVCPLYWAIYYGAIFTLFIGPPTLRVGYLVGAAATYALSLECWCWMDCHMWLTRFRFCTANLVYLRLLTSVSSLLVAQLVLYVHVFINLSLSDSSLFSSGFLLGMSGQLFFPAYEHLSLTNIALPYNREDTYKTITGRVESLHVGASCGRLLGVLVAGTLGYSAVPADGEKCQDLKAGAVSYSAPSCAVVALLSMQTTLALLLVVVLGVSAYHRSCNDGQENTILRYSLSAYLLANWTQHYPEQE